MNAQGFFPPGNHISFVQCSNNILRNYSQLTPEKPNSQFIYLLSNFKIAKFLPRNFTITTKSGSSKFNIDLITDASSVIDRYRLDNPDSFQYDLDISDDLDVLKKFERMFLGEAIFFTPEDIQTSLIITDKLNLIHFPNFMKPHRLYTPEKKSINSTNVQLSQNSLLSFLSQEKYETIVIVTKGSEYKCNRFGILASDILREYVDSQKPVEQKFQYDYEDEFNSFQVICDFFNFRKVIITIDNMDSIKQIAEDLQITCIIDIVNKFINDYETITPLIDEQSMEVDQIDNIFHLLYNKDLTLEEVTRQIMKSHWIQTHDDIHELAAFILQVVKNDHRQHKYILDLLMKLDQEANPENDLAELIPFIVKQLKFQAFTNLNKQQGTLLNNSYDSSAPNISGIYAFTFLMYQKGLIEKEDLFKELKKQNVSSLNQAAISFFLPELIEIDRNNINKILDMSRSRSHLNYTAQLVGNQKITSLNTLINYYLPDKVDLYKQMRDKGEPSDEATMALRNDDIDALQSIISHSKENMIISTIPFNIFETIPCETYINYAAAYGSVNCFKYLLLNHAEINKRTFDCAVQGGNIEIIKMVDNAKKMKTPNFQFPQTRPVNIYDISQNGIYSCIANHQNDLFDWIIENKLDVKHQKRESLFSYVNKSIENGNAHALVQFAEKGFDFNCDSSQINQLFETSIKNGYYLLTKILINLVDKPIDRTFRIKPESIANFSNSSIYSLFKQIESQSFFSECFRYAIQINDRPFIKFLINRINENHQLTLNSCGIFDILKSAIETNSNEVFDLLIDIYIKTETDFNQFEQLLSTSISVSNVKTARKMTDIIFEQQPKYNFAQFYINSSKNNLDEFCKYFVDKNVFIDFASISDPSLLADIRKEYFMHIINTVNYDTKNFFLTCISDSIRCKNYELVDYLLQIGAPYHHTLFLAIQQNDFKMVDLVLKYRNSPSFINRKSENGMSAIHIAALQNNLVIFKRLLSLPGINPCIPDSYGRTAMLGAVNNCNMEMINALFDFYNNNLQVYSNEFQAIISEILNESNINNLNTMPSNLSYRPHSNARKNVFSEELLKKLLQIDSIDFNNLNATQNTLLTYSCRIGSIDLINRILNDEKLNVNAVILKNGNSPLIDCISNGSPIQIIKLLIDCPRIHINMKNYLEKSALIVAVQANKPDIVDLIINCDRFDPIESDLNTAFLISEGAIAKKLVQIKSLNVNSDVFPEYMPNSNPNQNKIFSKTSINSYYRTPLHNAVINRDPELVELIINHPSFDKSKSQLQHAFYSVNDIEIFNLLINLVDDFDFTKFIQESINPQNTMIVSTILRWPNFKPKGNQIIDLIFKILTLEESGNEFNMNKISLLNDICKYDKEHDNLIDFSKGLPNGKTFFTVTSSLDNTSVNFLLDNGADPNVCDRENIYPFEYAILSHSKNYLIALIETNRIDFSIKIDTKPLLKSISPQVFKGQFTTYLHLLIAEYPRCNLPIDIINYPINNNAIDINVTDDMGETPLMTACRTRQIDVVMDLFMYNTLNYLHKNNEGYDAIQILDPLNTNQEVRNSKRSFLSMLRTLLGRPIG